MEDADAAPDAAEIDIMKDVDVDKLDWSQLNVDISTLNLAPARSRAAAKNAADSGAAWSSSVKGNGASSVSVKQPVFPFWDARIGADMTVVNPNSVATGADVLRQKYRPRRRAGAILRHRLGCDHSTGRRHAVGQDRRRSPHRSRPGAGQARHLHQQERAAERAVCADAAGGYNLIQQGFVPVPGVPSHPSRNYETDQSAKLSITDTGTSFTAGRTLSSNDDKWLGKVGAEQKLFDGVTISGSISETPSGASTRVLAPASSAAGRPVTPSPDLMNDPALPHIGPFAVKFGGADSSALNFVVRGTSALAPTRTQGIADERHQSLRTAGRSHRG
jgi:hypothetical protein